MWDRFIALWGNRFNEEIKQKLSEIVVMGYMLTDEIFNNNELLMHYLAYNSKPHLRRDIIDILLEGLQIGYPDIISSETTHSKRKNFRYLKVMMHPFILTQHHVTNCRDNPRFACFRDRFMVSSKQLKLGFPEAQFPFLGVDEHIYVQLTHGGADASPYKERKNVEPTKPSFLLLGVPEKNNKGWWYEEPLEIVDVSMTKEDIEDYATPIINLLKKQQSKTDND